MLDLVLYSLLATCIPWAFYALRRLATELLLYSFELLDTCEINALDGLVLRKGVFINGRQLQGRLKPADGRLHVVQLNRRILFCLRHSSSANAKHKDDVSYAVYAFHPLDWLPSFLTNSKTASWKCGVEPTPHAWQFAYPLKIHTSLPLNSKPFTYQERMINALSMAFAIDPIHNVSCLIRGVSKVGKSTAARYLADSLQQKGYTPIVVSGFSPVCRG